MDMVEMLPLYEDPHFTFRFAEDRLIPRIHLEGVGAGRRVEVYRIDAGTGGRLGLLTTATVGDSGWVDFAEPIIVRAGEAFVAVPESLPSGRYDPCTTPPRSGPGPAGQLP